MAVLTMAVAAYCSLSLIAASGSQSSGPGIKTETGVYPPSRPSPTDEDVRKQFGLPK
jgi:hypothetical protein